MPQVAIASSIIFGIVDADVDNDPANDGALYGKNGVAWVLRFGGVCTLVSVYGEVVRLHILMMSMS